MKTMHIWIVGASSGIGLELTKIWLREGHKLIASSRHASTTQALLELQTSYPQSIALLDIDITCKDLTNEVNAAWKIYGSLDRWFFNAGIYEVMPLTSWDVKHFEMITQTNYLGAVRLMVPLSKLFVDTKKGEWIWNISLSSYFGLPYGGAYSAPKAALLNLAESISPELESKGITLRIINHGFVKTRLTAKNSFTMPQLMSPEFAATQIAQKIQSKQFEIRFPFFLSFILRTLRLLPYKLSLWLTKKTL